LAKIPNIGCVGYGGHRCAAHAAAGLAVQEAVQDVGTALSANESVDLVHAGLLVVVDPLDTIVSHYSPHCLWQTRGVWHDKVVKYGDYVTLRLESTRHFFMDPIALLVVVKSNGLTRWESAPTQSSWPTECSSAGCYQTCLPPGGPRPRRRRSCESLGAPSIGWPAVSHSSGGS